MTKRRLSRVGGLLRIQLIYLTQPQLRTSRDIPTPWTLLDAQTHTTANFAHANHREPHCTANDNDLCETELLKVPGKVCIDLRCLSRAIRHRTSTSHSGTARRSPTDRIVPRDKERQPTASQRVRDGHSGCWSSSLRKHVGEDGHNRAKRAGTRRQRPPPQKVSSGQMCYTVRAGDYHRYHMYPIS